LNNLQWVENYVFKNYSQNGIKKHKNGVQKSTFTGPLDFTFSSFFTGSLGAPPCTPEPLRVLIYLICGNSSQYTKEPSPKYRTDISPN
jgi:hypothetical protein